MNAAFFSTLFVIHRTFRYEYRIPQTLFQLLERPTPDVKRRKKSVHVVTLNTASDYSENVLTRREDVEVRVRLSE